ncbi:MAG TPA: hypothetical protein VG755_03100 [Nannocystaceae bacterium]|nr:hypothetical protein [Nannocystaceae bacterium]
MRALPFALLCALPTLAHATNTRHERTPVVWPEPACMTLVDRSDGVLHLDYEIPFEDTMVTPDEVADSRTHQFFAMCRDKGPETREHLPNWITQADVDAATAVGLELDPPTAADIIATSADWMDCYVRIVADDARRPITFAAAMAGVDWDLASTPAGGWVIQGYTYEPVTNRWWRRPGVVKLHDGDPDAVGPVAAIDGHDDFSVYRDEELLLGGCVDAIAGTTFAVEYRKVEDTAWTGYSTDNAIDGDAFELRFTPPSELPGEIVLLRATFTDPMARTWTAYVDGEMVVIDAPDPEGCVGGFVGSMCGASSSEGGDTSSDTSSTGGSSGPASAESSTSSAAMPKDDAGGCGCTAQPGAHAWLLVLLSALRRRARCGSRSARAPRDRGCPAAP